MRYCAAPTAGVCDPLINEAITEGVQGLRPVEVDDADSADLLDDGVLTCCGAGSGGGGRPDMAQAGGPDADGAQAAIDAVAAAL